MSGFTVQIPYKGKIQSPSCKTVKIDKHLVQYTNAANETDDYGHTCEAGKALFQSLGSSDSEYQILRASPTEITREVCVCEGK